MARDTNFYYSFLVLPAYKRRAIVAIWDFCRAVDDAVDEAADGDPDSARAELTRWRRELAACFQGGSPDTAQGRALAPLVPAFGLRRQNFEALIEGVEMDILPRRYDTFSDLYEYCTRVASAVGLMCMDVFGVCTPRARQYATDLGVALQLTNILRDVPGDLARGRVYIPLEDFRKYGCTEADLLAEAARPAGEGLRSASVRALLAHQGRRAREYYTRASQSLPREDARRLVAAEIMGAIYRAILARIEARDYDVFAGVARVPRPERALIAGGVWMRIMIRP